MILEVSITTGTDDRTRRFRCIIRPDRIQDITRRKEYPGSNAHIGCGAVETADLRWIPGEGDIERIDAVAHKTLHELCWCLRRVVYHELGIQCAREESDRDKDVARHGDS